MTETVLWDADTKDANWISELQRAKGRIPDPDEPTTATVAPTAASPTPAEMAYSPGQKRDSVGRFGSGGGGSTGSSGSGGGGTAGETPEGHASRDKVKQALLDEKGETLKTHDSLLDQTGVTSERLKVQAVRAVGADLDAQFTAEQLETAFQPFRSETSGRRGDTPGEKVADAMLSTWAQGAYELNNPSTLVMQAAVGKEFKVGVGAHIQKDADFSKKTSDIEAWATHVGYDLPVMQAGVRSMYKHTQARLDELGVKGDITLHRGVGRSDIRGEASVDFNAASSWSVDKTTADSFAQSQSSKQVYDAVTDDYETRGSGTGTRLTMTVPRERVLSMPGHGIGCFEEGEVVVLRANGDKAQGVQPGYYPGEAIEP